MTDKPPEFVLLTVPSHVSGEAAMIHIRMAFDVAAALSDGKRCEICQHFKDSARLVRLDDETLERVAREVNGCRGDSCRKCDDRLDGYSTAAWRAVAVAYARALLGEEG